MRFFYENIADAPDRLRLYCVFLVVCILTTLDSGYIAIRWFSSRTSTRATTPSSRSFRTARYLSGPVLVFCGVVALASAVLGLELEYFMIFFGTFLVGYEALGIARCYVISPANAIPQVKMFCIGSVAVVIFAFGYFQRLPGLQMIGSLLPLVYVLGSS